MAKRTGLFSDIHGSESNLDVVMAVLEQEGVQAIINTGDNVGTTMSHWTDQRKRRAEFFLRNVLSPTHNAMADDVEKGLYSDEQIEELAADYKYAVEQSHAEARRFNELLEARVSEVSDERIKLGGNHDYREQHHDNGVVKTIAGIEVLCLSGSGSASMDTIMDDTLADSFDRDRFQFDTWAQGFRQHQGIRWIASHLAPADDKGVHDEQGVRQLRKLVDNYRAQGNGLDVFIHGHNHFARVKYDERIGSIVMSPGSAADKKHNEGNESFFITNVDEDNKLESVEQYEILTTLEGVEVRQTGTYTIDLSQEDSKNKVKFGKLYRLVLQRSQKDYVNPIEQDKNFGITKKENIDIDYEGKSVKEKDLMLRKNVEILFDESQRIQEYVGTLTRSVAFSYLVNGEGKVDDSRLEEAITKVKQELAKKAESLLPITNLDWIASATSSADRRLARTILYVAFGLETSESLEKTLRESKRGSRDDLYKWGSEFAGAVANGATGKIEREIFEPLKAKDYQEMAELHMPSGYERKKNLQERESFQFWLQTFWDRNRQRVPFLTPAQVEATKAYKKVENFEKNPKTKQEISDLFGYEYTEENQTDGLNERQTRVLREEISSGARVYREDDDREYVLTGNPQNPQKLYLEPLGDALQGIEYTSRTQQQYWGDDIRERNLDIIEQDGDYFAAIAPGRLLPIDEQAMEIQPRDYQPQAMSRADYISQLQQQMAQFGPQLDNQEPQGPDLQRNQIQNEPQRNYQLNPN